MFTDVSEELATSIFMADVMEQHATFNAVKKRNAFKLKTEQALFSDMSVNTYQTTRCDNLKREHLYSDVLENIKTRIIRLN
jgi:hypothetical protein